MAIVSVPSSAATMLVAACLGLIVGVLGASEQVVRSAVVGRNASSFFPGMMGGDSSMWEGDGDGIDEQIGWKVH